MATTTRTVEDASGTWQETLTDGVVTARQLVTESAAYTAEREASRLAVAADLAADATRAGQVQTILTALEAGTATNNQVQNVLAKLIRFVSAHRARS
jgi:hypothetical protein